MSDWEESTEGDLDPDLTEEAGYGPWDPPSRNWWPAIGQVLSLLALISILGTVAIIAINRHNTSRARDLPQPTPRSGPLIATLDAGPVLPHAPPPPVASALPPTSGKPPQSPRLRRMPPRPARRSRTIGARTAIGNRARRPALPAPSELQRHLTSTTAPVCPKTPV